MIIEGKVAVVTGAASGIGRAVATELVKRGVAALAAVDRCDPVKHVAATLNESAGSKTCVVPFVGDVSDEAFRHAVFDEMVKKYGTPAICVPAAGITRDKLSVHIDKETGKATLYPMEDFLTVLKVNLAAPVYWALELVGKVAESRYARGLKRWEPTEQGEGVVVFIGSVSSLGIRGQIAYSATKAGLDGVNATLMKEAMFYGVRCAIIHPGFTDTPMVRAMGDKYIAEKILPQTQLKRLVLPEEIAAAICFMISDAAISGDLWVDAGWHPQP
ncbi:MAG TPA: SDR family oxidoreductase [Tepidisphaeraceae bacterium]|nr:SDR family oxidoreductase [Tepidisphaeraceae bacterium]